MVSIVAIHQYSTAARLTTFAFGDKYRQMQSSDVAKIIVSAINRSSHGSSMVFIQHPRVIGVVFRSSLGSSGVVSSSHIICHLNSPRHHSRSSVIFIITLCHFVIRSYVCKVVNVFTLIFSDSHEAKSGRRTDFTSSHQGHQSVFTVGRQGCQKSSQVVVRVI